MLTQLECFVKSHKIKNKDNEIVWNKIRIEKIWNKKTGIQLKNLNWTRNERKIYRWIEIGRNKEKWMKAKKKTTENEI